MIAYSMIIFNEDELQGESNSIFNQESICQGGISPKR